MTRCRDLLGVPARTRTAHSATAAESRPRRSIRTEAACVAFTAAAWAVVTAVTPFGLYASAASGATGAPGSDSAGTFVTVRSDGTVELLSPRTGAVLHTLVGPSPTDSDGRHPGDAYAVTATKKAAFIAYYSPRPVIERIPLGGGRLTYLTYGMSPAVNRDGTELAVNRLASAGGSGSDHVVVRDLDSGSERTVYSGSGIVEDLSWSANGTELAMSGEFESSATGSVAGEDSLGVQLLVLNQPNSGTNPHFVGTPYSLDPLAGASSPSAALASIAASKQAPTWTDGQFLGSGGSVAAVVSKPISSACQATTTTVVSVDPTTNQTTTVASFPFLVPNVVFDHEGGLVAFERPPPPSCPRTSTTTTMTSGTGSSSSSETARAVRVRWVLYKWTNHNAIRLANDVVAVAVVP
jgi:hypothetical protein